MGDSKANKLTTKYCENADNGKHADGSGLYLHATGKGKYWRYDYRIEGKRKTASYGIFPAVSLKEARSKHVLLKAQLCAISRPTPRHAATMGGLLRRPQIATL